MKRLSGVFGLVAALATASASAMDATTFCRASVDGLVDNLRQSPAHKDPAHEQERQALLRQTEKAVADGRKASTDECALWRVVSTEVAAFDTF